MFLSKQAQGLSPATLNQDTYCGNAQMAAPQEYGVSSAIKELISQVDKAYSGSINLQEVLGISVPNEKLGSEAGNSLVSIIRDCGERLRIANCRNEDSLRHINS